MDYDYLSEKFSSARSHLMPPQPRGEVASVAAAMHECAQALGNTKDQRSEKLEPYLSRLIALMDTTGVESSDDSARHAAKAASFTPDAHYEFSSTVDDLARLCAQYSREQL